ncbi:MAG: DUF167 domain-containing protein [Pseudomonadota bacterium]
MKPSVPLPAPATSLGPADDGILLNVRVTPGARREGIEGLGFTPTPAGERLVLEVKVRAPPEAGRANAALIELLARELGLPKGALSITGGAASRVKRVHIRGRTAALMAKVAATLTDQR